MQSEGKLPAGVARRYPSAMGAYSIIVKCESTSRPLILPFAVYIQSLCMPYLESALSNDLWILMCQEATSVRHSVSVK